MNLNIGSSAKRMTRGISELLKHSRTLIDLRLYIYEISGIEILAKELKANKTLIKLHMAYVKMEDKEIECFTKALTYNKTLKKLTMKANGFGINGIKAFSKMLIYNTTLERLRLP